MLATNMFFWTWEGSPTQPPPPLTDAEIQAAQRDYGARGRDPYHPLPEDYWEDRKKIIQVDKRDPRKVFEVPDMPSGPKVLNHEVVRQLEGLAEQRDQLASRLLASPDVISLSRNAASIKDLDRQIVLLERKKFH